MAKGDGFESKLVYEWALPNVLLRARNELRDDAGSVLGQYEGHYMWDVERSSLVFWTVGRDGEMHSGTATWRDGHLWHDANVSGGRITGYRSVLGLVDGELRYQAIYQRSVTDSAVLASRPLIYRREKTGAQEGAIHGSLPGWFLHALEGLTRNGGRWEADNSDYEAETEPFPSYGLEYIIGSSGRTARGRLFGIRTDWQEQDFWEFLLYWDPLAGEAITM